MTSYNVSWEIDIEADTPKEAAVLALEIQQDPFSEAVFYTILNKSTRQVIGIDLLLEE